MKCCDAWGRCTRGDECCARASDAQPTQPPIDWRAKPEVNVAPLSFPEKLAITVIILSACCISGTLMYTGMYYLLASAA